MHAYLITMFVLQIIGILGSAGALSSPNTRNRGAAIALVINIAVLVWTSVLLWS